MPNDKVVEVTRTSSHSGYIQILSRLFTKPEVLIIIEHTCSE